MVQKTMRPPRRQAALSREGVVEASIELLDRSGESGLTFRALSERLATGPGAIYGHIAHKRDLLTAACDAVIVRTLATPAGGATPQAAIRAVALGMFDAIDAHPWVGSALAQSAGQLPMVRIFERLGQQVGLLGVPPRKQWGAVQALLNYILGVGGQNAANAQFARTHGLERDHFLASVSSQWAGLDPVEYPFTRSVAQQLAQHDDRQDFLAGIDWLLRGLSLS